MKKLLAFLSLVSITFTSFPAQGASLPVAGKSCVKVGQKIVSGKNILICSKNGSKKLWSKYVDDQVDILGKRFQYSYSGNTLLRKSRSGKAFSTDSRSLESLDQRLLKAHNAIHGSIGTSHPDITFNYLDNSNYPAPLTEAIKKELEIAANYWSKKIPSSIKVNVIFATEKDIDKLNGEWGKLLSPNLIPGMRSQLTEYKDSAKFYMRSGTGGGAVEPFKGSSGENVNTIFFHTASYAKMNTFWPEIAAHEFAHIIQGLWTSQANFDSRESYSAALPTTLMEGSANTLSYLMTYANAGWASDEFLTNSLGSAGASRDEFPMRSIPEVVDALLKMELPKTDKAFDASYAVGSYLYLWLFSEYGTDTYTKLYSNIISSRSFDQAVKDTYGISKADLYLKAAPYILTKWNYKN